VRDVSYPGSHRVGFSERVRSRFDKMRQPTTCSYISTERVIAHYKDETTEKNRPVLDDDIPALRKALDEAWEWIYNEARKKRQRDAT